MIVLLTIYYVNNNLKISYVILKGENMNQKNNSEKHFYSKISQEENAILDNANKLKSSKVFKRNTSANSGDIKTIKKIKLPRAITEIILPLRVYINSHIVLADTKASFLLGVTIAILTATYLYGPKIFKTNIEDWKYTEVFTLIGCSCLVLGICFTLFVVWPRMSTSEQKGLFSWVHVASYNTAKEYLENFFFSNEKQIIEGLYELNYDLSKVCKYKYIWLKRAFVFGFIGILICTIILVKE